MLHIVSTRTAAVCGVTVIAVLFTALSIIGGQSKPAASEWRVLAPVTQDNLTVFPVITADSHDTSKFLTLDEGLGSGRVIITEKGRARGLVRPRPNTQYPRVWPENPRLEIPSVEGAEVNRLVLVNNSERPLILLAGEIVTGGKQDRVVGKDRIVPPMSEPIELGVFCVEPHRWVASSDTFGGAKALMAQPSVRQQAMATKNQQSVWDQVAKARMSVMAAAPAPAAAEIQSSSSYAQAMGNSAVRAQVNDLAMPVQRSYEKLMRELRDRKAVGAVVALNGALIWADVFASPELLEKYWPKLVRSYAAEALSARPAVYRRFNPPSSKEAQMFLDDFAARRENVDSEPGVYRNTEITGRDFTAFVLTSLLPGTGFNLHVAKMTRE